MVKLQEHVDRRAEEMLKVMRDASTHMEVGRVFYRLDKFLKTARDLGANYGNYYNRASKIERAYVEDLLSKGFK